MEFVNCLIVYLCRFCSCDSKISNTALVEAMITLSKMKFSTWKPFPVRFWIDFFNLSILIHFIEFFLIRKVVKKKN